MEFLTPKACPSCSSENIWQGKLMLGGTDSGWVTRFYPGGIRFFCLHKSLKLSQGQTFFACLKCGHTWSWLNPRELQDLLEANGNQETQAKLGKFKT